MKKLLLILALVLSVFSLSGCVAAVAVVGFINTPSDAKFDDDDIIYNESTYTYSYDKFIKYYIPATESFNPRNYSDEKTLLGKSLTLTSIYTAWEKDFGDNVLQDFGFGDHHGYYFKEGFELPDYKTLAIDEVYVDNISSVKSESDTQLVFTDIVDYSSTVKLDGAERCGRLYCTLRDYDSILLGGYNIVIVNNEIYVEIPELESDTYGRVNDSYQAMFKEIVCKQ